MNYFIYFTSRMRFYLKTKTFFSDLAYHQHVSGENGNPKRSPE